MQNKINARNKTSLGQVLAYEKPVEIDEKIDGLHAEFRPKSEKSVKLILL